MNTEEEVRREDEDEEEEEDDAAFWPFLSLKHFPHHSICVFSRTGKLSPARSSL